MVSLAAIFPLGIQEMLVILAILVLLFGARRIPELARGLGEGIRGFRTSLKGEDEAPDTGDDDEGTAKSSKP